MKRLCGRHRGSNREPDRNMKNNIQECALDYLQKGFSVIPVGQDKRPLIKWEKYQTERATTNQINSWFQQFPHMNIGIVTGAISGVVVLDLDIKHGRNSQDLYKKGLYIPPTVSARSGGGGEHFFFKHSGQYVKTTAGQLLGEGVDIKGDGGYVVVAPSLHPSGNYYEWSVSPDDESFAELPQWLLEKMNSSVVSKKDWKTKMAVGTYVGSRNSTATEVCGKLLHDLSPDLWDTSGWDALYAWNNRNPKPLEEKELRAIFESIKHKESAGRNNNSGDNKDTTASLIVGLINDREMHLFHDGFGEPYIQLNINGHKEIWRCRSKQFKRWVSGSFWKKYHKIPSADAFNSALSVIESKACFDCDELPLFNRVAKDKDAIWYDLANKDWHAVSITTEGWKIVTTPPILFRRYSHQATQCTPVTGGDIQTVLKYINISNKQHQLLFLVYLVSCFIPDFPHPVPNIYGGQGSAKSTVSKLLRRLIDPSKIEVTSLPNDCTQLTQLVAHHWFLCFDNISFIHDVISDMLCKIVSGSGFSKRELYSDDEDIIYSVQQCIVLNGINLPATKPDLLERSVLFELPKLSTEGRVDEKKLYQKFEQDKPLILGAIFDVITRTLKIEPLLQVENLPRMADFARWGCAITQALGYSQEEFLDAYRANISMQNEEVLDEHIESLLLIDFIDSLEEKEWIGKYSILLDELKKIAKDQKIEDKLLPKSPNALSRRLNILKPNLEGAGLIIICQKGGERLVTIRKTSKNIASTASYASTQYSSEHSKVDTVGDFKMTTTTSPLYLPEPTKHVDDICDVGDVFSSL